MKKACMKVKKVNNCSSWEETYLVEDSVDTEKYLNGMLDKFNATLMPHESAREILEIWEEPVDGIDIKTAHMWEKTNLVTITKNGMSYDTCKCAKCGITGKRFGLCGQVQRDTKYKSVKYNYCSLN